MKSNMKKFVRLIYILITVGVIVAFGLFDPNFKGAVQIIPTLKLKYVLLGVFSIGMYWIMDAVSLKYVTGFMYKKVSFLKTFRIAIIGQYYSALTPSSTGGQPMQVMYMKRDGIPVGTSTCIMLIKFICYQLGTFLLFLLGMVLRGSYYFATINSIFWLSIVGFLTNFIVVVLLALSIFRESWVLKIGTALIRFGCFLKIIKNKEKTTNSLMKLVSDFRMAVGYVKKYKLKVFINFLMILVHLLSLYSITTWIYLAFGQTGGMILDIIFLQVFLTVTVTLFPMPGATGASEIGFYGFMAMFFKSDVIFLAMLMWRLITYYSNIFIGAIYVLIEEILSFRKNKMNAQQES
ncbi:MAG: lysylphosphatidylglycerol synthase transmembrane domain-containing protein [Eubacteriales bacterium]